MQIRREQEIFNISIMANKLKQWGNIQHKAVLVLGSRAGSLFRSEELYSSLKYYGDSTLNDPEQLQIKKFGACLRVLSNSHVPLSRTEIDQLFRKSLVDVKVEVEDLCLARLIIELRVFDTVITTCLDPLLEQTLEMAGWKEMRDFDVYTPPSASLQPYNPLSYPRVPCRIIKIFGQMETSEYTIPRANYIAQHQLLFEYLQRHLRRDCLVIGLDSVWDAELYNIFPTHGESIWYINEEPLDESSRLALLSSERTLLQFVGAQASYKQYFQQLHWNIFDKIPIVLNEQTASLVSANLQLRADIQELQEMLATVIERQDAQQRLLAELLEVTRQSKTQETTERSA